LPATIATDGKLITTPSFINNDYEVFATGTATAGGASTLTNAAKSWLTNQWANSQIRIVSGTGAGQIRTIASNTGTVITTSASWTTNPDATSVYNIEGNDDFLYLLGNNAVTMYRYSISANTWTTLAPTAARAGAHGVGGTADWIDAVQQSDWQDGTYGNHLQNGTLEETHSEFTGKLKKLTSNFYIGKNSEDKSNSVADFLKGKIAEIKIWDKFIPKEFILENNETPIFELENNSNLIYNETEIGYDTFEVCNNKIPYRREGRFLSLPHSDEGFVNGKWVKGETTAKNERRLFLEMKKEKINYKEDGIAQIKYDLVSKEQIADNAWMLNVKL
jgi:hypothetical protein